MSSKNSSRTGPEPIPLPSQAEPGQAHFEIGYARVPRGGALINADQCELTAQELFLALPQIMPENSLTKWNRLDQETELVAGATLADLRQRLLICDQLLAGATADHISEIMAGLWEHFKRKEDSGDGQKIVARDWIRRLIGKPVGPLFMTYEKLIASDRKSWERPTLGEFLKILNDVTGSYRAEMRLMELLMARGETK